MSCAGIIYNEKECAILGREQPISNQNGINCVADDNNSSHRKKTTPIGLTLLTQNTGLKTGSSTQKNACSYITKSIG